MHLWSFSLAFLFVESKPFRFFINKCDFICHGCAQIAALNWIQWISCKIAQIKAFYLKLILTDFHANWLLNSSFAFFLLCYSYKKLKRPICFSKCCFFSIRFVFDTLKPTIWINEFHYNFNFLFQTKCH